MNSLLYSNRVNIPYTLDKNTQPNKYNNMMVNIMASRIPQTRNIPQYNTSMQNVIPIANNIHWYNSTRNINNQPPIQEVEPPPVSNSGKMVWGQPVWFLLHTLSYKVKEETFPQFRDELLRIIYVICTNLPCPTCSEHAKTYLDGINMATIRSKEQLKIMLFTFHNVVNQKKGYPIFSYNECEAKYTKAITINMIHNFMPFFKDKARSLKLMASDFQKRYTVKMLEKWFQKNIMAFDV